MATIISPARTVQNGYFNPGAAINGLVNTQGDIMPAGATVYTSTTLPAATNYPIGTLAYTSDLGVLVVNSSYVWSVVGGAATSEPSFAFSISATLAASQNNYAPTGYVAGTTNRLLLAAASGGSTITGLAASSDGCAIYVRNTSATNTITFSHLSGSSTSTNQFSCPQAQSALLAPLSGVLLVYVSNIWTFA
jgi:hypothetical protein